MVFVASNTTLQNAVNGWCNGSITASTPLDGGTYGAIGDWDVSAVTDMSNLFWGANFNEDIGNWDTLNVTSMSKMFFEVQSFNQSIGNWDVSKVNDMNNMFNGAQAFNNGQTNNEGTAPLNWDVSSVTDMNNMFNSASAFNQPIGNWDVSNVTSMYQMFANGATVFNQPINTQEVTVNGSTYTAWDVSSVSDMSYMFYQNGPSAAFNQSIGNWDVSSVTTMDSMFNGLTAFNQPIPTQEVTVNGSTYTAWDVSNVKSMSSTFQNSGFNNGQTNNEGTAPLYWDVSNVTDMSGMFSAPVFNQPIGNFNTSSVYKMLGMFDGATAFNQSINTQEVTVNGSTYTAWDTSKVENMQMMFSGATAFNQPIGNWNTSKTNNLGQMFRTTNVFDQDIVTKEVTVNGNTYTAWETKNVTNMWGMFKSAPAFNQNIGLWDVLSVTDLTDMFSSASAMHIRYTGATGFGDTPTIAFFNKTAITQANIQTAVNAWISDSTTATGTYGHISNWDVSAVTDMSNLFWGANFNEDIGNWDTLNVTSMSKMFFEVQSFNQSIGNWDVSKVNDMNNMFNGAQAFNNGQTNNEGTASLNWDVSSVTDMNNMFNSASAFNQPIGNWDVSSVTDMNNMFNNAQAFDQPINTQEVTVNGSTYTAWDVSSVSDMSYMFSQNGQSAAFNQSIGNWDVSSVTTMDSMFTGLTAFNQPIPTQEVTVNGSTYTAWDVSSVSDMSYMFQDSGFNNGQTNNEGTAPLYWDVSKVNSMISMFNAPVFNQPIGNWNTSSVYNMYGMFAGATAFNQSINTQEVTVNGSTYTAWDVSSVSDMGSMFTGATAFNQPIGSWDVSSVTNMQYTFQDTLVFDQDITKWNVSKVSNMWGMFKSAPAFNKNIGFWKPPSGANFTDMFTSATAMHTRYTGTTGFDDTPTIAFFNKTAITQANIQTAVNAWVNNSTTATSTYGDISNWDTSAVTDMSYLFRFKNTFNDDISNWDVSSVTNMFEMFLNAEAFNNGQTNNEGTAPLNWNVSNVTTMAGMFHGTPFNQPISYWNVSKVIDMTAMFSGTTINGEAIGNGKGFNQDISTTENVTMHGSTYTAWDTSNVTSMYGMFTQNGVFAQSISNWDVSKVNDMGYMFSESNINPSIGDWNVSNVTRMTHMFASNPTFNQNISDWNLSKVNDVSYMFDGATAFNNGQTNNEGTAPLKWDVSNVTTMVFMFRGAVKFNQSINTQEVTVNGLTYTAWDVSKVTTMYETFRGASAFNQPIGSWDVSSVTDMSSMFQGATLFNQSINFWTTRNDVTLVSMFLSATAMHTRFTGSPGFGDTPTIAFFNKTAITQANIQTAVTTWLSDQTTAIGTYGHISYWDTSAVTNMNSLFYNTVSGTSLFNDDIGNWDTSAVTDMNSMFLGCSLFNQDIGNWDTGNVSDMAIMFNNAQAFNQPIGSWDVSKVTNMNAMFVNAPFNQPLANWERTGSTLGNVTDMSGMFNNAQAFNQSIGNWDVSNVTSMQIMFNEAEAFNNGQTNNEATAPLNWNVSKVTDMNGMFNDAPVFNQPIGNWNVSNVTDMSGMFNYAIAYNQPIGDWDVSKVTYMQSMFSSAETFDVDISNWNVGNVIDMSFMFYNNPVFDQPINTQEVTVDSSTYTAWDVSNVTDMNNMFGAPNDGPNSVSVFNQPIGSWDVSKVNNMENMFYKASVFDQPIGNWDVGNVNYMKGLFYRASSFKQDISNWDVSNVSDMDYMFFNASVFDGDISGWNITKVTTMMAMFYGASVFNHPLANWERFDSTLGNVTTMQSMFYEASVFDQPIGNWNVSLVNDMSSMFSNSAFNQSINEWTVSNVTDFTHMFDTNNAFYQSIRVWAVDSIANTTNMFYHADGLQKYYEGTDLYTATPSPSGFFNLGYTPPEITITGDNPVTVQAKTTYNDAGATATDSTGNVITVTHTSNVNMNQITTAGQGYEVKYNATDSNGHSAIQRIRTVNVVDTERPKIKLVGDEIVNFVVNTPGGYVDEGATATDNYYSDALVTSEIKTTYSPSDIITTALGTYTVTYSLTDDSGNKAYDVTRTVNVIDTPPTITITGDSIVNLNLGDTYTDQGATATDMLDGTVKVTTYTGDVDTSKIGTYKVKYTATNSVELTTTVHRKVVVADKHIPVITLKGGGDLALGESPVQINVNSAYTDPGAKAHDYVDGDITSHIVTDPSGGNIDTSTLGIHKITFNVTDSNHLAAKEVTRTVNVVDTGPTIKLQGSSQVSVDMGVTYDDPDPAVIATDPGGATITITTDGLPVDTSVVGTHTISYTATNTSNLSATVYRKVTVTDPYFPDIKLNGSTPVNIEQYSKYVDAGVKATETVNGTTIPESDIQTIGLPIDTSVVGTHTVTYKVTDAHGNTSKAQRTVNVKDDPPVITLNGISPYEKTVQQGQPYHDNDATEGEGATAGDSIDGDLTHYIKKNIGPPDYLDTSTPGTFTITYNVSDSAGLAAVEKKRIINVHDPNSPTIKLLDSPDGRIKDTGTIEKGSSYTDPGATASDVFYGSLTNNIVTDPSGGNIDTSTLGEHKITYNVTNPAGNAAVQRTRIITVVDGKPKIILAPGSPENVPYGGTYIEPGYKAYDFRNTNITSKVVTNVAQLDTKVVGDFKLTYNVEDEYNVAATQKTRTVHVYDNTPPVITMTASADGKITNTGTIELNSVYIDPGATAWDTVDGTIIVTPADTVNNVDTSKTGVYTVIYTVKDAEGNSATATRTITVKDVPPVIKLNGKAKETIMMGSDYTDPGAIATDYLDGTIPADKMIITGHVDTSTPGTYTIKYNASDQWGNAADQVTRTVIVHDQHFPVISIIGDISGNEVEINSIYNLSTDPGATAWDYVDGDITSKIITDLSNVNTSIAGTYTVKYSVEDSQNNISTAERTVDVEDSPPVITLNKPLENPVTFECKSATPFVDPGATAYDKVDGDLTKDISTNIIDLDTSKVHDFSLNYFVVDSAGNSDTKTRVIKVRDSICPVIAINGTTPVYVELNSTYVDEGATSIDNVDGNITGTIITHNPVNTKKAGTYTVTYTSKDLANNITYNVERKVIVQSPTPTITLIKPQENPFTIDMNDKYDDPGATASDSIEGDLTSSIHTHNPLLTNTSVPGTYSVTYTVRNIAGNSATATRTVIVHDPDIPVITLEGDLDMDMERYTKYIEPGYKATDKLDGTITTDVKVINNVNPNKLGTYTVTYNVKDKEGNSAKTVTRTVNVLDVRPVITLIGDSLITIDMGDTYVDQGATAGDYIDGSLTDHIVTHNPVDTSIPGKYYVTYNVTNPAKISAKEVIRTVVVSDPYIPVITLIGDSPVTVELRSDYVDAGAIATDKVDGDITNDIDTKNEVITSRVGTYYVIYNVKDKEGNKAKTVTRTVKVVDIIPVIELNGNNPAIIDLGVTYVDAGAIAYDSIDGNLNVVTYNPVNTKKSGTYQVMYNAKNHSGISAKEVTRTVVVHDPYIPTIIMKGVSPITIEQTSRPNYVDAGATATDKVDGDITGRIRTVNNVNQKKVGTYTVTYNVTDAEGNHAHPVIRTVNVENAAPVIKLNGSNPVTIDLGVTYVDAGARASDPLDGDLTSDIKVNNPVNTNKAGTYIVTYNVTNSSGKSAEEVKRTVVVYDPYIPTIIMLGITPVTIDRGETYTDAGAIATDKIDGDITADIITYNNVNTDQAGTYRVIYNVTDNEGSRAHPVTRIVIVKDSYIPYTKPKDAYYVGDSDEAITNSILTRGWNTAFARDTYNGKERVITPFRAVNNAGDYLARQDYKCGGPTGMSKSSIGWASSTIYLGSQINNCDDSGVPGASGNVKYVYDSSDYVTFRRQQAINRDIVRR